MLKERIRALCRKGGTSIPKLELELGLGSGSISKWDKVSPKADTLQKIADRFGVTVDYLLTGRISSDVDLQLFSKDELEEEALRLLNEMPPEMKKAAIEQLKALAALNKK